VEDAVSEGAKLTLFRELSDLSKRWNTFEDIPASQQSECRGIGRKIYALGGEVMMREAYYHAKGANPSAYILAAYWDGIGEWQW
jgi:hypothetical protein